MNEWTAQIDRLSMVRILVYGLGCVAAAMLGTIPAEGVVDLVLFAVAAAATGVTGLAANERRRIDNLPLVLAANAVRGVAVGRPVFAFRAWLGRGRVVRSPTVEISFIDQDGSNRKLAVALAADVLCGPWTFLVADPGTAGRFVVRVVVREGLRDWEAHGEWDRAVVDAGRFAAPVNRVGGRLQWTPDAWDTVIEPER